MNIALFSDSYLPLVNGIASSLGLLNEQLLKLGHQVTVFTPQVKGFTDSTPNIVRVPSIQISKTPPFYFAAPLSSQVLKKAFYSQFDVIHTHTPLAMGGLAYQAALLLKRPLIYTYHTLLPEYMHYLGWPATLGLVKKNAKYLDAFSCNLCQLVIAPSEKAKHLLQTGGVFTRCEVVPNGIKLGQFTGQDGGYLRTQPNIQAGDKVILAVGRLGQEKNPLLLVKALPHLLDQMPQVKLVFAGSGYLLPQLSQLAQELQVNSYVVFLGDVPFNQMPALYAAADLLVSAATTEVHPISLLEALAAGLPVVAVHDDAFASVVVHGVNGFLTPLDAKAFAGKVLAVLQNPELQTTMAAESLRLSRQFSIEVHANRLLEIYAQLNKRLVYCSDMKKVHHRWAKNG